MANISIIGLLPIVSHAPLRNNLQLSTLCFHIEIANCSMGRWNTSSEIKKQTEMFHQQSINVQTYV